MMDNVKQIARAYSQTPWRKQVQFLVLFLVILAFIVIIAGVYLDVTSRASAYGRSILEMQREMAELDIKNADLRTQLGEITSASTMDKRAEDLGFQRIQKGEEIYIVVPDYVKPDLITFAPPPKAVDTVSVSLPPRFSESLLEWIRNQFVLLTSPPSQDGS